MSEPMEVSKIIITRTLSDDDDSVSVEWTPDDTPLIELLGLLRFAEDSVIRSHMGEEPHD